VLNDHRDSARAEGGSSSSDRLDELESMLIVDPGDGTRIAIDLSTVARLEEFAASNIERSRHSKVVQYRGQIMPLIQLGGGYGQSAG